MKSLKKALVVFSLMVCAMAAMNAQQHITNFGIVNTEKVYNHFYRNSAAIKTYEKKKADMQAEINKKTKELKELKASKDQFDKIGDTEASNKLAIEIKEKTEYLRDYTTTKNLELQNLKKSLSESNEFYVKLSKTIKRVAENEGLSTVLSLQGENAILWYSQTVDITDKVIKEMEK